MSTFSNNVSIRCVTAITLLACAVITFVLTACGTTPSTTAPNTERERSAPTESAAPYWETLNRIANGSATQQADVFYEAEREYINAPTTANTLRYALALVAPAHPASNPVRGKKLLEQLLANPERLSATERSIAAFLVKDAEVYLQLEAENRRLNATVDERSKGQANFDRRVQTLAEENTKLRKQLDEAQRKLDAIKSIDRSIIERSSQPTPAPGTRDATRESSSTQSPSSGR
jgi:YfhG lipoprotein